MKIPRGDDYEESMISLTSFTDMMFILIIFFVTTSSFEQEERDELVNLPNLAESTALSASADKLIILNVRSAQRDAGQALYTVANRALSIQQLGETIRAAVAANKNQKILIRGDERAWHGDVAAAIAACRMAGVDKVNIGYELKPAGK
jgi:biopolymer transport protein ExbD